MEGVCVSNILYIQSNFSMAFEHHIKTHFLFTVNIQIDLRFGCLASLYFMSLEPCYFCAVFLYFDQFLPNNW